MASSASDRLPKGRSGLRAPARPQCPGTVSPGNQHPAAAPRQSRHFVPTCFIYPCLFCFFKKKILTLFFKKMKVAQSCPTFCNPMNYIQSMEFSRPEHWSGFSRGSWTFPTPGLNPGLPHCGRIFYQLSHKESPRILKLSYEGRLLQESISEIMGGRTESGHSRQVMRPLG